MSKERLKAIEDLAIRSMNEVKSIRLRADIAAEKNGGVWTAEDKEASERASAEFNNFHQQKLALEMQLKAVDDFNEVASGYEKPRETFEHRAPNPAGSEHTTAQETAQAKERTRHRKAYHKYILHGENGLTSDEHSSYMVRPAEQFALVGNVDNLGGFLVPDDETNELIKDQAGFAVMRQMCKVRSTIRQVRTFLTVASGTDPYSSGVSGSWRQEGDIQGGVAPATQNQPTFGRERVPTHIWRPDVIELTMDLLEDSSIDIEAELRLLLAEVKSLDEDSAFINGNGVGQPEGVLNRPGIVTVDSGSDTGWIYGGGAVGGILNLWASLPAQYRGNARWLMSSITYVNLLTITVASATIPLFPPNSLPGTLLGRPIAFSEFMPSGIVDGNKSIVWGDFNFYGIVDRRDLRVQRLIERYAPNIGILATGRTGGQVLKNAPVRIGVTHSSQPSPRGRV